MTLPSSIDSSTDSSIDSATDLSIAVDPSTDYRLWSLWDSVGTKPAQPIPEPVTDDLPHDVSSDNQMDSEIGKSRSIPMLNISL